MQTRSSEFVAIGSEAALNERRRLRYELKRAAWHYAKALGCTEPPSQVAVYLRGGRRVTAR